jgi:predicted signal transduction protein with EAL and GGDEF domain
MAKRVDTTGKLIGLNQSATLVLARLSARALQGRALLGVNEIDLAECGEALEALARPGADTMGRLELWLTDDYARARRLARRLSAVLEACGTLAVCGDPAQTAAVMRALQKLAYNLGAVVETRAARAEDASPNESRRLLEALQRRLQGLPAGEGFGLVLLHCAVIDQVDALRGLPSGDSVVNAIARNLRGNVLRASDAVEIAARDEFACLLHPMPSEGVAILAAQKMLRVLDAPLELDGFAAAAEPKIGIALFPEHGLDAAQLLQHAKAALRTARSGHDRIALFRADAAAAFDESRYAMRLRHAIQNNGLRLFYQPQAEFRTGRIIGAEALLRWDDEQLGAVAPSVAVEVAESTGMINDLTCWAINGAIQQCAAFRGVEPHFTVSVNISPSNLHEADLPAHVGRALRTWDVPSKSLVLEITETAILGEQKLALEALNDLKRLGLKISVDDFGTGYSSMYYLAQMPLDELKIDLMFVRQMLELPQHAKIVRSLIDLAHNLELSVVAEGVESEPVWSALQHLGCDCAQGWYIGKPVAAEELMRRLRARPGR